MPLNIVNNQDLFDRAIALQHAGRNAEAEQLYLQLLQSNPAQWPALCNLSLITMATGRTRDALAYIDRALRINPNNAIAWNTAGEVYRALLDGHQAIHCYNKAIAIEPGFDPAWGNLGIVHALLGRITEAIGYWQKAIDLCGNDPAKAGTLALNFNNLGNVYLELGEIDRAIECHRRACELNPAYYPGISNLLRDYNHHTGTTPRELLQLHKDWVGKVTRGIVPFTHANDRSPERPLRVGLVSPDFREHAVAYFLMGLFDHYDRTQFEFHLYPLINNPDIFTQQFMQKSASAKNLLGLSEENAARVIQQDRIDILIDLAGHTGGSHFRIFAYKPAPVQVAYLGYPCTVGLDAIDYRITDNLADPAGVTDSHFTEKLVRLDRTAWCYRPPVALDSPADPPSVRNNAPFTFGSFNNYAKLNDDVIALWSRILQQVPGSRLLLKANALQDQSILPQIHQRFARHGIDPDRLVLRGKQLATSEHLKQYLDVDLALDTFPYNGTTTTCEALCMNTPVVVLEGNSHMSRVGVSLLSALKLQELIAKSPDDYVRLATRLATDSESLTSVRRSLRTRFEQSPLSDAKDFAQKFTGALRNMWRDYCIR